MSAQSEQETPEGPEASAQSEHDLPEAEIVEEPAEELSPEEELQRERDEYYENWRRAQADFQNLRRRQSEVINASVLASKRELLSELLLVLDYLDMALLTPVETQEGKNLAMGVSMTRDQMMQFLSQREVEPIATSGAFDPSLHEAVETVERDDVAPGTILETSRTGYTLGKDVLRYANVKVSAAPSADAKDGDA